jgi:serine phosphatase RsbU (regulator of sigma subunit)
MASIEPQRRGAALRLAGHPPPLVLGAGRPRSLEPGPPGPPIGVVEGAVWPAHAVALPEAWSLLLFTDGVMDGRVGTGPERLGEEGLIDVVAAARHGAMPAPGDLVRLIVERAEELNAGPLADDVALLLIERRP